MQQQDRAARVSKPFLVSSYLSDRTLASIGLYGVLAYSVSRRIRVIGLRIALGARSVDVPRLVLSEVAWILGVGLTIGILAAIFLTNPLAMFLVAGLEPSAPCGPTRPWPYGTSRPFCRLGVGENY